MVRQQRTRSVRLTLALVLVLAASAMAGPVEAAKFGRKDLTPWLTLAAPLLGPTSVSYGSDGRLTVLVLGSDFRPTRGGERTDAVMIATINPQPHAMAAVSIPRDTGALPLPDPGDTYKGKVNSLFSHYRRLGETREQALDHMRRTIAYVLDIEIDNVVYARFTGFDFLVDQVGVVRSTSRPSFTTPASSTTPITRPVRFFRSRPTTSWAARTQPSATRRSSRSTGRTCPIVIGRCRTCAAATARWARRTTATTSATSASRAS
jgi:anionic cell wall polymer biosynthesis LytR-Cps2A-Psr (LCP) family protein